MLSFRVLIKAFKKSTANKTRVIEYFIFAQPTTYMKKLLSRAYEKIHVKTSEVRTIASNSVVELRIDGPQILIFHSSFKKVGIKAGQYTK